ncbi:hypothetical protein A0H81_07199 [Grifola frondosa]|uniref:Uncharacterized protein n=1 Tax=Grifola frondosa TaxID=5627 RepID=A0A1C7M9N4_GRIFR|nr:hypothetical protein A0H81_07199 [Grifola frondosa]
MENALLGIAGLVFSLDHPGYFQRQLADEGANAILRPVLGTEVPMTVPHRLCVGGNPELFASKHRCRLCSCLHPEQTFSFSTSDFVLQVWTSDCLWTSSAQGSGRLDYSAVEWQDRAHNTKQIRREPLSPPSCSFLGIETFGID